MNDNLKNGTIIGLSKPKPVEPKRVPKQDEKILRKMDHRQWLVQFSDVLQISPQRHGVPMTPFRAGAIGRLQFAAQYIEVLEADIKSLKLQLEKARDESKDSA